MLKNYLLVAARHFQKQKFSSIINVIGLTIAIATCIFILLFVFDELKYDEYNEHKENTYRLLTQKLETGDRNAIFPVVIYTQLLSDVPEIENGFRLHRDTQKLIVYDTKKFFDDIYFADNDILEILTLPLVRGNEKTVLAEPFSVIITEKIANKYFGSENPIGKKLTIENNYDLQVTGVLKNIPSHSHIHPNIIASFNTLATVDRYAWESLDNSSTYFYFYLNDNTKREAVQEKIMKSLKKFWGEDADKIIKCVLEPLDEIYLYSTDTEWDIAEHGDVDVVITFITIALFIMLMAVFNFTNLLTTLVKIREKELAVRKLLGAGRKRIIIQYLFESFFYLIMSLLLSFLIVELLLDKFNIISAKHLSVTSLFEWEFVTAFAVLIILVALISILYPVFITFKSDSLNRLKGNAYTDNIKISKLNFGFRQIVTGIQFIITVVLIIAAFVIYNQVTYARNAKLGFNKEHLLVIENPWDSQMYSRFQNYKNAILNYPGVESVSASGNVPGENINNYTDTWLSSKSKKEAVHCAQIAVDYNLFKTLQAQLISGRDFSEEYSNDPKKSVVINQAAVDILGLDNPIGVQLNGLNNAGDKQVVIGVVENIHFKSFKEKMLPIVFYLRQWSCNNIVIRLKANNILETMKVLESEWSKIVPDRPFLYSFVDESFDNLYNSEKRTTNLIMIFCILSIAISFIGLLSLVDLVSQMRKKELGIRKILGASVLNVASIMFREYLSIIIVSYLIAVPIAYYFLNIWLEGFVYRINMGAWTFIIAGFLAVFIGFLAISYRIIKSANLNPVENLRSE